MTKTPRLTGLSVLHSLSVAKRCLPSGIVDGGSANVPDVTVRLMLLEENPTLFATLEANIRRTYKESALIENDIRQITLI
jgi:hypothetical protein